MVSVLLLALALGGSTGGCTRGTEDEPALCPTHLPAIASVAIEKTGERAYREPEPSQPCAHFRPTAAQVRRFLAIARTTDAQSADATLDRSPCFASGRVRFADGRRARWKIEQYRVGTLQWRGGATMLLYCRECRTRPFVW